MVEPSERDREMADYCQAMCTEKSDETAIGIIAHAIAGARAEGEAEGRRKAREACAALLERHTVIREHAGMSAVKNMNLLLENMAAEVRALAEQPADGSGVETPYEPSVAEVEAATEAYLSSRNDGLGATLVDDIRAALIAAHKARAGG